MTAKIVKAALLVMASAIATGCANTVKEFEEFKSANALTAAEIEAAKFTPEVMWKMGRVGAPVLSPAGDTVLYTVSYYSMAENRSESALYSMPAEGGDATIVAVNAHSVVWNGDGTAIYYMSADKDKTMQVWSLDTLAGSKPRQLTAIEGGIEGFGVSGNDKMLFYVQGVDVAKRKSSAVYEDMDKSGARIYDDIMVRHWDYWDEGNYKHIFVAQLPEDDVVVAGEDIMKGEAWDAPMAPYFDMAEIAWNPDGTKLAYTCKKMTGREYAVSTDSDIYVYDVASKSTSNICKVQSMVGNDEVMPGYDRYPVFSPDGRKLAFRSMRRAGNESDIEHLVVWNVADNSFTELTPSFDYSVESQVWDGNDRLYFLSAMEGTYQICRVAEPDSVEVLTAGDHDITALAVAGERIIFSKQSMMRAPELFALEGDEHKQLTFVNKDIYDNIKMGDVQKRWVKTTDGKQMLTWVIVPPEFDEEAEYPALLYCQGGPQSVVSQFWSYRWNFMLMAAEGYVVVAPNRRGTPSFGSEWLDQISGDYSGQNIEDYLAAIDDVADEEWVDEDRLGAVGASYGGYSVFYLAGVHDNRFKALIAHCGIFDFESMYGETEELWFVNRDYGGAYWDKNNETAQRSYANSPHKLIHKWTAPILIITGEKDYRIPYTQSLEAFTAARLHDVPARLVEFTDEAHQVFKPQNSVVWNREFFSWLNTYLK